MSEERPVHVGSAGRGRVHHLGIRNAISEQEGVACFGILQLFENRIVLQGYGGVKSLTISCPQVSFCKSRTLLAYLGLFRHMQDTFGMCLFICLFTLHMAFHSFSGSSFTPSGTSTSLIGHLDRFEVFESSVI